MKTPEQVLKDLVRRLDRTWWAELDGNEPAAWPHAFPLAAPSSEELGAGFADLVPQIMHWQTWARTAGTGVRLRTRSRRVLGTSQEIPTHLEVGSVEVAAGLAGREWSARLMRGRDRAAQLAELFSELPDPGRIVRAVDRYSAADFDLLCRTAAWFRQNPRSGFTPRQVPVEGLHTKWLGPRQDLVRELSGLDNLGLVPGRPGRVHFTYLDPHHLAEGSRRHDSATMGDVEVVAYQPRVVIIAENKDSALGFGSLPNGIAVEGGGRGAAWIASLTWVRRAEWLFYWGDMDADGLEILNEFRAAGLPAISILMDMAAFRAWQAYGVSTDRHGEPLLPRRARALPHLSRAERELYLSLCSPDWSGPRRIEQERIPLVVAERTLKQLLGSA